MNGENMAEGGVVRARTSAVEPPPAKPAVTGDHLREKGKQLAAAWKNIPHPQKRGGLQQRFEESVGILAGLQHALREVPYDSLSGDLKWLSDHLRLFAADTMDIRTTMSKLEKLPFVRSGEFSEMPRGWVLMRGFGDATGFVLTESAFTEFVEGASEVDPLDYKELSALGQLLKLVLFEETAKRGRAAYEFFGRRTENAPSVHMEHVIQSLQMVSELDWEEMVEPLSPVNRIFLRDPGGVYPEWTRSLGRFILPR